MLHTCDDIHMWCYTHMTLSHVMLNWHMWRYTPVTSYTCNVVHMWRYQMWCQTHVTLYTCDVIRCDVIHMWRYTHVTLYTCNIIHRWRHTYVTFHDCYIMETVNSNNLLRWLRQWWNCDSLLCIIRNVSLHSVKALILTRKYSVAILQSRAICNLLVLNRSTHVRSIDKWYPGFRITPQAHCLVGYPSAICLLCAAEVTFGLTEWTEVGRMYYVCDMSKVRRFIVTWPWRSPSCTGFT
jgi:hypothetical protein